MIRTICLGLIGALMFCGTSNADFVIDDFSVLDTFGDPGSSGTAIANGITVTATATPIVLPSGSFATSNPPTSLNPSGNYSFGQTGAFGAAPRVFTIAYDWGGSAFESFTAGLGERIEILPSNIIFGNPAHWTVTIDRGGSFTDGATFSSPMSMIGATKLDIHFDFDPGGLSGASIASFGGSALTAVPEPTSLLLFGSVVGLGFFRRRRR